MFRLLKKLFQKKSHPVTLTFSHGAVSLAAHAHLTTVPLYPGVMEAGSVIDHDEMVSLLQQLTKKASVVTPAVADLMLNQEHIHLTSFAVPMTAHEDGLPLALAMHNPFEDHVVHYVGHQIHETDDEKIRISAAYADQRMIESLMHACRDAGFTPRTITVAGTALSLSLQTPSADEDE